MKKHSKAILAGAAALFTLLLLTLLGLHIYINSAASQARIREELGRALRMPVQFSAARLTLAGNLRIDEISVPDRDRNFFEAAAFHAKCHLLPLLHGRLEIYEMSVDEPRIVWLSDADGRWQLPKLEREKFATEKSAETAAKIPAAEKKGGGLEVVISNFNVRNASLELLDQEKKRVANLTGIQLHYATLTAARMEGTARIERATWNELLTLQNASTPFTSTDAEFTLPAIQGKFAGGPVTGNLTFKKQEPKTPFALTLKFENANAALLSKDMNSAIGQMSGILDGDLELHGSSQRIERTEGTGSLHLRGGRISQLEILEAIGLALQIRELSDLSVKEGRTAFHIERERVYVDDLTLDGADLRLAAKGTVKFDGRIDLDSQLAIDDDLFQQLPIGRDSFATAADNRHAIAFNINGKHFKPGTNLFDKMVGTKITGQLDEIVSNIFGTKKKPDPAKDAKDSKKNGKKKKDDAKPGSAEPPPPSPDTVAPPADPPASPEAAPPAKNP